MHASSGSLIFKNLDDSCCSVVFDKRDRIEFEIYGENPEHGLYSIDFGVTGLKELPVAVWTDKNSVVVQLPSFRLSQGEWRSSGEDKPVIKVGDVVSLQHFDETMFVSINKGPVWSVNVGPGRVRFCAQLRYKDQALWVL